MAQSQPPRIALVLAGVAITGGVLCLGGCRTVSSEASLGVSPGSEAITDAGAVVQGTVQGDDGLEIAYDVRGSGEVALVFIHCWACDRSFWSEQLDVFADDYRVVSLDLGGHGASGRDREAWYLKDLARDVAAVVQELDLERVILVGHSMAGPISLEAARQIGARVEGVVCVDSLHNAEITITDQMVEAMAAAFERAFAMTMDDFVLSAFSRDADPELVARIQERRRAIEPEVAIQLLRDLPNLKVSTLLSAADVPVRCINPGGSPTQTELNQRYADFQAVLLDGASHFPMLENPAPFNEALSRVLKELTAASGRL